MACSNEIKLIGLYCKAIKGDTIMAQVITDKRDVEFVLHEQLEVEKLAKYDRFAEFNRKTVDLIISEARNLAVKEMLPVLKIADEEGCKFENGTVKVAGSVSPDIRSFQGRRMDRLVR